VEKMSLPIVGESRVQKVKEILGLNKPISPLLLNKYLTLVFDVSYALNLQCQRISCMLSGYNTIIQVPEDKRFKIYAILLMVDDEVSISLKSEDVSLTGTLNFSGKGDGFCMSVNPPNYLFKGLKAGDDFKLYLSSVVMVDGFVSYWLEDV